MVRMLQIYHEGGFDGLIRPDHAPTLEGDAGKVAGYAMGGKILAIGYMKGIMDALHIPFEWRGFPHPIRPAQIADWRKRFSPDPIKQSDRKLPFSDKIPQHSAVSAGAIRNIALYPENSNFDWSVSFPCI